MTLIPILIKLQVSKCYYYTFWEIFILFFFIVLGRQEDVEACKDHLLNLEEEYMQDVVEAPKAVSVTYENLFENAMKGSQQGGNTRGFVVQGAPWEKAPNTNSQIDFPDFGLREKSEAATSLPAWNPNR